MCKICSREIVELIEPVKGKRYYYCMQCSFIGLAEEYYLSLERERERYLLHQNSWHDERYVAMFEQFMQKSIFPFHDHIRAALDFGSGPQPVLARCLSGHGIEVDIYDIYFASEQVYLHRTYDLITCTEVLEHLANPLPVFVLLKELLNPGGILAVMTLFHPVEQPLTSQGVELFFNWWYRRDATHISFFRPETFCYLATLFDLELIYSDGKNTLTFRKKPHIEVSPRI